MHFNMKCFFYFLTFILNTYIVLAEDIRLLVAAWDRVMLMDANGTTLEIIVKTDNYDIQSVAFHETKNYIYWSSWSGNITRLKYPSIDNDTEVIFHQEAGSCSSSIAVDSINDYLYWSNCSDLVRSNLDGLDITPILNFSTNGSVGILEVDSRNG
ncbi:uncharacterized protein LOC127712057 [Mytilus californianus]|uniref:uncharacterized protein LOC127712057 n=1 Tax=Mytilus californianus TaxID=6549 RepID=UPI0022475E98|nr:uncharacterized protein LOC127712057 [Mytilus californianus]